MPTYGLHLPDGSEIERLFLQRISREYRGKAGPYLRNLVDRDLTEPQSEPPPSPIAPDVMETLTRVLCGHGKGLRMRAALAGVDQVQHLTDLLESHLLALEAQRAAPGAPSLVDAVIAQGVAEESRRTEQARGAAATAPAGAKPDRPKPAARPRA